jgi:hypothetical protein
MKEILAAFALTAQTLKAKADAALSGLGPVDQYAAAGEVNYALSTLKWVAKEVEGMLSKIGEVEAKFEPEIAAAALALVPAKIDELVTAGELFRKTEHDLALDKAKKDGEEAATLSFAGEKQELETVTARRLKLTTDHGVVLAAIIPDAVLKVDEAAFSLVETEVGRRVTELATFGIDPVAKEKAFKDVMACGYDEAGIAAFDNRVAGFKELGIKPGKAKDGVDAKLKTPGAQVPPVTPPEKTEPAPAANVGNACF